MRRVLLRTLPLATTLALAVLAPATAGAQTRLPVGESHGVRMALVRGGLVVTFTKPADGLFKKIAGKEAWVECTHLGEGIFDGWSGGGNFDVPRHRHRFATGDDASEADFCRLFQQPRTVRRHGERIRLGRTLLVSVSLTQRGAVYLDEEAKAITILKVEILVGAAKEKLKLDGFPTYAQLEQRYPPIGKLVVPLAAPGDTPPRHRVGYYSDGAEHAAYAIVSGTGRRLFVEYSAGGVISGNVIGHLFGDPFS